MSHDQDKMSHPPVANELHEITNTSGNEVSQKHYAVLLLSWEKELDDLGVTGEVDALEEVFHKRFHSSVRKKQILSGKSPRSQVQFFLASFMHEFDSPSTLLIVYYTGHGIPGKPGQLKLAGSRKPDLNDESIKLGDYYWHDAEKLLKPAVSSVLVIFDCCFAGNIVGNTTDKDDTRSNNGRSFQFLGACQANSITAMPGPASFTTALIWALEKLADLDKPFTTFELMTQIRDNAPKFPRNQFPYLCEIDSPFVNHLILAPLETEQKLFTVVTSNSDFTTPRLTEMESEKNSKNIGLNPVDTTTTSRDSGYSSMLSKPNRARKLHADSESVISFGSQSTAISSLDPANDGGAVEQFAKFLLRDEEIRRCVEEGFVRVLPDRFGRNLARLLKHFAIDLRKEAVIREPELHHGASHFIRSYRAYTVSLIRSMVLGHNGNESQLQAFDSLKTQEASKLGLERHLAQDLPVDDPNHLNTRPEDKQESDDDSQSDDNQQNFPNEEKLTALILSSEALKIFKAGLRRFVDGLEPKVSSGEGSIDVLKRYERQRPLKRAKNAVQRFLRPPVRANLKRVEWICGCGDLLYMDFDVNSSGSLQTIEALQNHQSATSHPAAATQPSTQGPSRLPSTPMPARLRETQISSSQSAPAFGIPEKLTSNSTSLSAVRPIDLSGNSQSSPNTSFVELCVNKGEIKSLAEISTSMISTDGEFFFKVKQQYLQHRSFRARLWLLKPSKVSWVRFSLENHHRVGILHKPRALPPKSEVDERRYTYYPCPLGEELPIDPNVFIHYVFCSVACPRLIWLPRIPRKLGSSIFSSNDPVAFGWGIHIDEGPHLTRILFLNVIFIAGSIISAVLWKYFIGDFQGAMGLAALIVMFFNTVMVYYVLKWNEA